jgi:hypothetical protein
VCVSESICMKVCMIVCLVLYIFSWILGYFIMGVCQWGHLYESLHDCVSCPVYIVLSRVLSYFIMGVCQWEHMYESLHYCVSCPVYIVLSLKLFHYGCVSVRATVWKFACLCVLSCIYCLESLVISFWVCVSESICMKVCMIVCLDLYILSWVVSYIYRTRHTIIQAFIHMLSLTHTHNEIT